VLAIGNQDEGAIVCCTDKSSVTSLCPDDTSFLPFANRLARWPDAWLLPLFPLILRLLYIVMRRIYSGRLRLNFGQSTSISWLSSATSLRRLGYYIILLNFRGWVLYVGFNAIEDLLVRPVDQTTCWYYDWLRSDQPQCFGRVFDFSDHIVLYYAQILPVSLFECLHALEHPYWKCRYSTALPVPSLRRNMFHAATERLIPLILCSGMIYLYFITCLGVYKTALYFHTGWEVVVGFLVSQLVYMPLCLIQCSDRMEPMREFLFATSAGIAKYKSLS
jgi:hypothetical protein